MHDPTDETLMAYADGLLDAAQAKMLEEHLAKDPALQARLEPFVVTGRPLARLYQDTLASELPDRLVDTIFAAGPSERVAKAARVSARQTPGWLNTLLTGGLSLRLAGAITAGIAVGVIAGWLVRGELSESTTGPGGALVVATARGMMARGDLAQALETTPTGKSARLGNGSLGSAVVAPELTFATDAGSFCRQYRVDEAEGRAFGGVACRVGPGEWRIDVHTPTTATAHVPGKVRPASQETAPAVTGAVDKLIATDPLTVKQEEELISTGWQPKR